MIEMPSPAKQTEETKPPLCLNCRRSSGEMYCHAPMGHRISLVTGYPEVYGHSCNLMRSNGSACGPEGRLFEPKVARSGRVGRAAWRLGCFLLSGRVTGPLIASLCVLLFLGPCK